MKHVDVPKGGIVNTIILPSVETVLDTEGAQTQIAHTLISASQEGTTKNLTQTILEITPNLGGITGKIHKVYQIMVIRAPIFLIAGNTFPHLGSLN